MSSSKMDTMSKQHKQRAAQDTRRLARLLQLETEAKGGDSLRTASINITTIGDMSAQLSHLPEVKRLSSRVIRILGGNPGKFTLQGTNTYIVGTGPTRILIDSGQGMPSWIAAVQDVLASENAEIGHAIITHWHRDHTQGIPSLLEAYKDVKVYKNQPEDQQIEIRDEQQFAVEGATLRAVHAPGHTQDHMCLILEEEDAMFTGDNVLGHGTAVFENLTQYVASLDKMRTLFSGRAYPGHGPVIENGTIKIEEYIRHRRQREDQVIQVLRSDNTGSHQADWWASMEIVKIIYRDVPEHLHEPAEGSVLQVLWKLEDEAKAIRHPETGEWRLKNRATL